MSKICNALVVVAALAAISWAHTAVADDAPGAVSFSKDVAPILIKNCQACHGPIETMAVVSQQRSLQMGWCINCHRNAKVDVANNDYYEKLHAGLKIDGKEFITVAQNGGLECGKCHY